MKMRRFLAFLLAAVALASCLSVSADDSDIVDPYVLYTYEEMLADLAQLEERYPQLISVSSLGQSVEGRELTVFTLGTGKREILMCASMHAREYVGTNFVMYMTEQYCKGYVNEDSYYGLDYKKLLDQVRFVIVPMINPDGVVIAQNGIEGAENYDALINMPITDEKLSGYYAWKANANGVDLNRNWPHNWTENDKVSSPASANYNGPYPCSEPETIAMKKLIDSTPFYMFCSFHTSGKCIYWNDNSNSYEMYAQHYPIVRRIARGIGYSMVGSENVSKFGGYMINYARAQTGKVCMTVELCPYFNSYPYPYYSSFSSTVNSVYPIGLLMANEVVNMEPQSEAIDVKIDDKLLIFTDCRPVIENSRTLIPLRSVCEACGFEVSWEEETQGITVTDGEKVVNLAIDSNIITVDGEQSEMDCVPKLYGDRTLLPMRAVMEAFGIAVAWDGENETVLVFTDGVIPDGTPGQEENPPESGDPTQPEAGTEDGSAEQQPEAGTEEAVPEQQPETEPDTPEDTEPDALPDSGSAA